MKKKSCMIALTIVLTMSMAACGKKDSNSNVEEPVSVEVEETVGTDSEVQENAKETKEAAEEKVDASSIGKVRTALSDSGVEVNPDAIFSNIPNGIAPEFTYYLYDNVEGMVKAQQYLEEIGVSEEGKKIVVYQRIDHVGALMNLFVISFEDGGTYRQDFRFVPNQLSYESMVGDLESNCEYCDDDARYIRTNKIEYPTAGSYEETLQYYESMGDFYTIAK